MVQHKAELIKHFRSEGRLFQNGYTRFARRMVARHFDRTRPASGQKKARKLIWGEILNEFKDHPKIQDDRDIQKATDRYLKSYMASSPLYLDIDPTYRQSSTQARDISPANCSVPARTRNLISPGPTSVSAPPVPAWATPVVLATGTWQPRQGSTSAEPELLGTVDCTDELAAFLKSCEIAMDHRLDVFKNAGIASLESLRVLAGWPAQDQAEIWGFFEKEGARPFELKVIKRGLNRLLTRRGMMLFS